MGARKKQLVDHLQENSRLSVCFGSNDQRPEHLALERNP